MGNNRHRFLVGTYTRAGSRGIYAAEIDARTGVLGEPALAAESPNPTFLALAPDGRHVYAVCAGPAWASSFRVEPGSPALAPVQLATADAGPTPCHIAVDGAGRLAVAANYHLGLAAVIPLGADGALGAPRTVAHSGRGPHPRRQDSPHVHSANFSPDGRFALVCDLGLDRIYSYRIDRDLAALAPGPHPFVSSAPAAGPRHLAFAASGRHAYVINELDNTVVAYAYEAESGRLCPLQSVSVLPEGYAGEATAAEVRVHPAGRFLYGSCRGSDTIAVFAIDPPTGRLTPVETVPCGGKSPRNFAISPDGAWLVCAHQASNSLCSFGIDAGSGRLRRVAGPVAVSMPVCVLFLG
jgi:6-phosphogluconolactonase